MEGVYTAIVTPFKKNGEIDYKALEALIAMQVKAKVAGIVIGGTTGESATISAEEKEELYAFVFNKVGKLDLVAGTGTNCTEDSVKLTEMALNIGYKKVLVVTPYYNKPTCKGLFSHYKAIADTGAKIVLYNVPGRTSLNVAPECLKRLSGIKNIIAVKEASGNIGQFADYLELAGADRFDYLSGDDYTIVPFISMGGKGVISVISNILPEKTVKLVDLALDGRFEEAAKMQIALNSFIHAMFMETSPLPTKTALAMMGLINEKFRAPLDCMEDGSREKLKKKLKEYKLL